MNIAPWIMLIVILVGWAAVSHFWITRLGVTGKQVRTTGCACSTATPAGGTRRCKGGCCGL